MIHELHLGCGELRLWVSGSFKDSFYGVPLRVPAKVALRVPVKVALRVLVRVVQGLGLFFDSKHLHAMQTICAETCLHVLLDMLKPWFETQNIHRLAKHV